MQQQEKSATSIISGLDVRNSDMAAEDAPERFEPETNSSDEADEILRLSTEFPNMDAFPDGMCVNFRLLTACRHRRRWCV